MISAEMSQPITLSTKTPNWFQEPRVTLPNGNKIFGFLIKLQLCTSPFTTPISLVDVVPSRRSALPPQVNKIFSPDEFIRSLINMTFLVEKTVMVQRFTLKIGVPEMIINVQILGKYFITALNDKQGYVVLIGWWVLLKTSQMLNTFHHSNEC